MPQRQYCTFQNVYISNKSKKKRNGINSKNEFLVETRFIKNYILLFLSVENFLVLQMIKNIVNFK